MGNVHAGHRSGRAHLRRQQLIEKRPARAGEWGGILAESLTPAMFALLLALTEGERHGYALMGDADRLSRGAIILGPGTLYRTLQRMRVDGFIVEVDSEPLPPRADRRADRRRIYRITEAGLFAVRAEAHRLAALLDSDAAKALLRMEPGGSP
jgi:DNA-binding PadR family transcriptional regulator